MTEKLYKLVSSCIEGVEVIAVAVTTYCCKDAGAATTVNAAIILIGEAACKVCQLFVKSDN